MKRRDRVRRAALICGFFVRNLAYYRAARPDHGRSDPRSELWTTIVNNFLDVAVLEWCKVFADERGHHHWRQVVAHPEAFGLGLLRQMDFTEERWADYKNEMRTYRDKFLAHLDRENVMNIPDLTAAYEAVSYFWSTIHEEDDSGNLKEYTGDLARAWDSCAAEAGKLRSLAAAEGIAI